MGTKNNPGSFDCFGKAEPDEPHFTLLGRDPAACFTVVFWVKLRIEMGQNPSDSQMAEARECAKALEKWAKEHGKEARLQEALDAFERLRSRELVAVSQHGHSFLNLPEDLANDDSERPIE